jgi:hypothetical protein
MQQGTPHLLHHGGPSMLFSHWYTSPTPLMEGASNVSSHSHVLAGHGEGGELPLHLLLRHGLAYLQH